MILETFRQALQNVWSNKLRTFLTMLGIIIGVMAVIVIVGLGNGMTRSMRDSFSAMGTSTLSIQIWGYGSRTATVDDLYNIVKKNPELLSSISPELDFSDNTPKVGTTRYRYGTVYGVDENYIESKGYTLAKGRNIQYMDIADNKQICVIGDYINRTAYGGNAVGQTIKLGAYKFRIVGVLKAKISNPDQQEGSDDDAVYLPYTTAMRLSNESSPDSYSAIMVDESRANEAKAAVEQGLYDIFKSDSAYYVYSASEWLEEMNKMINMVIVILTGIASISLLVGGIGIMNIMLVSVTERTREIGIRKAIGAERRSIIVQFLIEAAMICGIGGLYYVLDYNQGIWATTGQIEALGWLAVALVIFTTWKPLNAIWGAYLFGMLYWLYQFLPTLLGITMASHITDLVQMLPYVVTIVVLIVVSMRKKKENQPPAHLGLAYFREER